MLARVPFLIISIIATTMAGLASASEPVRLYAAGSLRAALTEVAAAFAQVSGSKIEANYGASGLLRDEIVGGARADVFASANMEHPQALASSGKSGPAVLFARNRLCALARPGITVEPNTLLDRMLDPAVKLATSTPKADPSGDYAWEVFRKADAIRSGSFARLSQKALQLVGGPSSPQFGDRNPYGALLADGRADIFLAYCTGTRTAVMEHPDQRIVALPDALAVGADYGLTVLLDASPPAHQFAMFILSPAGQRILAKHGFSAPNLPQGDIQ
jgi:ABC-type molybdate transport system substrate-binding protein